MNETSKRLVSLLGLLGLLAGCGKSSNPVAPVTIPPLSSLVLAVHADTLQIGQTRQFAATALDTSGAPYTGPLDWSSGDPHVFTVGSTGIVRAVGEGSAFLFAAGGGRRDSARVLVVPAATGWTAQISNASEELNGVFFDPAGRLGWVVGKGGVILSTTDAGTTWRRRTPTTFDLQGVWFTSATEGWAVGNVGTILSTTNGGTTWARVTTDSTSENLMHVHFASRDVGWVCGTGGLILRTEDRGATWHKTFLQPLDRPTMNGLMFAGANDGWAVGEGGVLAGTHDGGDSWFVWQPSVTGQPLKAVWRRSATQAAAVGSQGAALLTVATADSATWELNPAGSENQLAGVCFPTDSTGYAVGWNSTLGAGTVLRSDTGGRTWAAQSAAAQFRLNAVYFVDERRGWAVGAAGTIRHTASGGQ
jgi:photosystem II stability/assembly factor-like uncharacterized protein